MRETGFCYANAQGRHAVCAYFCLASCKTVIRLAIRGKLGHLLSGNWVGWRSERGPASIGIDPSRRPQIREAQSVAKENALPKEIAGLSFEDALKELEGIVQQLERGQVKLDEAISAYERGALLKRHCEQKLAEAKMKVEKIVFSADGSVSSQPSDLN
jgi:exodeoxyribonuclease VII small subunit